MICSNCGMDIPFTGNVCPFCKADKSADQKWYAIGMMILVPLVFLCCGGCCLIFNHPWR